MKDSDLTALARSLGAACRRRGVRVATAESCTGGGVAEAITRISGSSEWFDRGFVTYSNDAKQQLLDVPRETIAAHGAVSEETAREMARGALKRSRGSVAAAVTGIAGPSGGSAAKPVGMVCFSWAARGKQAAETRRFRGDRAAIRRQSVVRALEGVLELLAGG
jgi:nicotinamide-nucleotide amidase